jgi:hypothetical protein
MNTHKDKGGWVTKLGKDVHVELLDRGPAVQHNLMCWLCNKNHAVYDMNPNWIFRPCWDCQEKLNPPKRIKYWKNLWGLI